MSDYSEVYRRFWSDEKVRSWSDDGRLLALYILTCEHRRTEGLFRLPLAYIQDDLQWTGERLAKPFGTLIEADFIRYDFGAQVILVVKALKYAGRFNPNRITHVLRHLEKLPSTSLTSDFRVLAERFCKPLANRLPKGSGTLPEQYGQPPAPALTDVVEPDGSTSLAPGGAELLPTRSKRALAAAIGVVDRLKLSIDSGKRSWSFSDAAKAEWDALLDDDGNLTVARDFLVWFMAEMTGRVPAKLDWQMAMQKVKRYRARALYGVEQAVIRVDGDGLDFWKYVEAVCKQAQARSEGST